MKTPIVLSSGSSKPQLGVGKHNVELSIVYPDGNYGFENAKGRASMPHWKLRQVLAQTHNDPSFSRAETTKFADKLKVGTKLTIEIEQVKNDDAPKGYYEEVYTIRKRR